jgi:hypothetical protein
LKFASFAHLGISVPKILLFAGAVSAGFALLSGVVLGGVLGPGTGPALLIVAALVFYIILSAPRRILDSQRIAQARESVLLSASSVACLRVTGSRSRTAIMLRSGEPSLEAILDEVGRRVLLGFRLEDAAESSIGSLGSYSAAAALRSLEDPDPKPFDPEDEETRGLAVSSELNRETKLPIFMTACFFAPIMLLLYAVFSHSYSPGSLIELVALEFIMLDLAFYLSSGGRGIT